MNFIDEDSHECLETCAGVSRIVEEGPLQGNLCNLTPVNESLWIGLGAGSAAGIIFCLVVLLIVWCCRTKQKGHINFVEETSKSTNVPDEKIRKIPGFDNKGYENEETTVENSSIDEQVYIYELENMRLHEATLKELLIQVRTRLRAMDCEDTRVPTYKNVIHQLCRVLSLLNKENTSNLAADSLGLLEWAKQMLNDYYEVQQQEVSSPPELTRTPISNVDVQPIYAVPHDSCHINNTSQSLQSHFTRNKGGIGRMPTTKMGLNGGTTDSGYYSSVPVPYYKGNRPGTKPPLPSQRSRPNGHNNNNNNNNNGYWKKENPSNGLYNSKDIYTCTSSYSERSGKCMSTFIRDDISNVSECSERSSSSAPDGLPFDMKDATEPIEV